MASIVTKGVVSFIEFKHIIIDFRSEIHIFIHDHIPDVVTNAYCIAYWFAYWLLFNAEGVPEICFLMF